MNKKTIWVADDGTEFDDEAKCQVYEQRTTQQYGRRVLAAALVQMVGDQNGSSGLGLEKLLLKGVIRRLEVQCFVCEGYGFITTGGADPISDPPERETCEDCDGNGWLIWNACISCKGSGLHNHKSDKPDAKSCTSCNETGQVIPTRARRWSGTW